MDEVLSKASRETDLIQRLFAPLSLGHAGSFGLRDDAAFLAPTSKGHVITQDQVIEGTHFLGTDPLDIVAKRLVRRNLSDLIAKGCKPTAAFLSIAWPHSRDWSQLGEFARGLGDDLQVLCGACPLMGGDTSTTSGLMVASLTLIGEPTKPAGGPVLRSGARAGDVVVVTGVIGDAWLGLQVRLGILPKPGLENCARFASAPAPPKMEVANIIGKYGKACIDISDGLLGDGLQLGQASDLRVCLNMEAIPLSFEAMAWTKTQADKIAALLSLATGGDDYQPLLVLDEGDVKLVHSLAADIGVTITQIGVCQNGEGVRVEFEGKEVALPDKLGWSV